MGIADVTKRDAVLDAIDEYEDSGPETFLRTYPRVASSGLVIDYVGQQFPAGPIVSAAHRVLHGEVLEASELTDEPALVAQLKKLGFNLSGEKPATRAKASSGARTPRTTAAATRSTRTPAAPPARTIIHAKSWSLEPGDLHTRSQISAAYGGSKFSDIEFSARTRSILLFSDPSANPDEFDGWDSEDQDVYHFTAEGRRGDQQWTKSNRAVLDHITAGQTLRLFEAAEEGWRPGGKQQRYAGEFMLDPETPWRFEEAPDADGNDRKVIVFRLRRVSASDPSNGDTPTH